MSYKADSKRKSELKKQTKALEKPKEIKDPNGDKKTILVPHPSIPKTFIEKVIK